MILKLIAALALVVPVYAQQNAAFDMNGNRVINMAPPQSPSDAATQQYVDEQIASTPGGSDKSIQYNDSDSFGGDNNFTWDKSSHALNVTGTTVTKGHTAFGTNAQIDHNSMFPSETFSSNIIVDQTSTNNVVTNVEGITDSLNYNPVGDSPNTAVFGLNSNVEVDASNNKHIAMLIGHNSAVEHFGSGIVDEMDGLDLIVNNRNNGTLTSAYGLFLSMQNAGGGSIGTAYGLYLGPVQATAPWSIYQSDSTAPNWLGANTTFVSGILVGQSAQSQWWGNTNSPSMVTDSTVFNENDSGPVGTAFIIGTGDVSGNQSYIPKDLSIQTGQNLGDNLTLLGSFATSTLWLHTGDIPNDGGIGNYWPGDIRIISGLNTNANLAGDIEINSSGTIQALNHGAGDTHMVANHTIFTDPTNENTKFMIADGVALDLDMNSHPIVNVTNPTNPQDAATKNYADTHSPSGTLCGWYDTVGVALITSCQGHNPNVDCPSGYTQKTTTGAKFCSAN